MRSSSRKTPQKRRKTAQDSVGCAAKRGRPTKRNSRTKKREAAKTAKLLTLALVTNVHAELNRDIKPKGRVKKVVGPAELLAACKKRYPLREWPSARTMRRIVATLPRVRRRRRKTFANVAKDQNRDFATLEKHIEYLNS